MLSEISQAKKDKYQMISLICGVKQRVKTEGTKQQNSSRLTDSKKGLVVTKAEGCGREKGIEGYYDWHTWCWGNHGEDSAAQRRQVVTLWHLTMLMDSDCNGVWGELNSMGECSNHVVFHVKPS